MGLFWFKISQKFKDPSITTPKINNHLTIRWTMISGIVLGGKQHIYIRIICDLFRYLDLGLLRAGGGRGGGGGEGGGDKTPIAQLFKALLA